MSAPGTKPLSADEIARLRLMYYDNKLSVIAIAALFRIRPNTVNTIARRQGWTLRSERAAAQPVKPQIKRSVGSAELEVAKRILRRRGRVVFNATVDGSGPKGFVKCDGNLFTADEIIHLATRLP